MNYSNPIGGWHGNVPFYVFLSSIHSGLIFSLGVRSACKISLNESGTFTGFVVVTEVFNVDLVGWRAYMLNCPPVCHAHVIPLPDVGRCIEKMSRNL